MIEILNKRDVFTIRSSMMISPAPTDTETAIATIPSFCIELKPIYHSPLLKSKKHDNISEKEVKNMKYTGRMTKLQLERLKPMQRLNKIRIRSNPQP